ncbi:MAG: hypothetical protein ACR2RB_23225 [Gammaproteobacteria bacterium]
MTTSRRDKEKHLPNHDYPYVDPDLHVIEPGDLWQRYVLPGYRDNAPVGSNAFAGDMYLLHEGRVISRYGRIPMMEELYDDL